MWPVPTLLRGRGRSTGSVCQTPTDTSTPGMSPVTSTTTRVVSGQCTALWVSCQVFYDFYNHTCPLMAVNSFAGNLVALL